MTTNILLIENNSADGILIKKMLERAYSGEYRIAEVESLSASIEYFQNANKADLIILDLHLPESKNVNLIEKIEKVTVESPLVVLADVDDEELASTLARHGAEDYIVKDECDEQQFRRVIRLSIERRKYQLELVKHSLTDSLTNLPKRTIFFREMENVLNRSIREKDFFIVLFIDLDNLKIINDTYGHIIGDEILKIFSKNIKNNCRNFDLCSRFSGDEFIMVLVGIEEKKNIKAAIHKLHHRITGPVKVGKESGNFIEINVSASVGVSVYPDDSSSVFELINCADKAMYHAKKNGKNHVEYFSNL